MKVFSHKQSRDDYCSYFISCSQSLHNSLKAMDLKTGYDLMLAKLLLPIDTGNQFWGYILTLHRARIIQRSRDPLLLNWQQLNYTKHCYSQRRPTQSLPRVDTSSLTVKMVERRNLSHICCKWTVPAKLTHETSLPLMSPDNITHCLTALTVEEEEKKKENEFVTPRII